MRTRKALIVAATVGVLVLTAGTAFAAGAAINQDGAPLGAPAEAMSEAVNGWQQASMHGDGSASMHREGGMPMGEADRDAAHRDGHMGEVDHDAMHAQMREHMPAELREDCDIHHDERREPDA